MFDIASGPDLLRLLAVPAFGYVAWLDIRTRRVPNRAWLPLLGLGAVLLLWDLVRVTTGDTEPFARQNFYVRTLLSLGFVVPLAYVFWRIGGFGGADAKAFFVVAVLLPVYPTYELWRSTAVGDALGPLLDRLPGATYAGTVPLVETPVGVFSLTVLSNTVLLGALYPVGLAARNAAAGYRSPGMFVAKPVRWDAVTGEYGTLLQMPDRPLRERRSLSGLGAHLSVRGLDLDALRMYLRWRGCSLAALREQPDRYRDPETVASARSAPGDGAIPAGGWDVDDSPGSAGELDDDSPDSAGEAADTEPTAAPDDAGEELADPWAAAAFLTDIEGSAYGTTPAALREGLETLTDEDVVWISPGIPFLVPLFLGLVAAFVYGDLLFALLRAVGVGG